MNSPKALCKVGCSRRRSSADAAKVIRVGMVQPPSPAMAHPFSPCMLMPSTNCLWKKKKITRMGISDSMDMAKVAP